MMAHRRAIISALLFLSLAVALAYAATTTGWRSHRVPVAGRATIQPATPVGAGAQGQPVRMCVSLAGLCAAPPLRLGDPCSCPHPIRGMMPGRIERLDQPKRPPVPETTQTPVDLFDWHGGVGP